LKRDLARKQLVAEQIQQIEKTRLEQLKQVPKAGPNLMVLVLMRKGGHGQGTPLVVHWRYVGTCMG